jgi:saccharopine dehydrogenase (NAD+, L-lysine-forming)
MFRNLVKLINSFKPDIVVNVALPYQDLHIMDACLETGVAYLDTANYEPLEEAKYEYSWQWAYKDRFKKAGITAILVAVLTRELHRFILLMLQNIILMNSLS